VLLECLPGALAELLQPLCVGLGQCVDVCATAPAEAERQRARARSIPQGSRLGSTGGAAECSSWAQDAERPRETQHSLHAGSGGPHASPRVPVRCALSIRLPSAQEADAFERTSVLGSRPLAVVSGAAFQR